MGSCPSTHRKFDRSHGIDLLVVARFSSGTSTSRASENWMHGIGFFSAKLQAKIARVEVVLCSSRLLENLRSTPLGGSVNDSHFASSCNGTESSAA